jgi:hypothetical protein
MEQMGRVLSTTVAVTLSDINATLSSLINTALGGAADFTDVSGCMLTCEDYDCRIAFGVAAVSASLGHVLSAGGSLRLSSKDHFNKANIINKSAGSNAVLQITVERV